MTNYELTYVELCSEQKSVKNRFYNVNSLKKCQFALITGMYYLSILWKSLGYHMKWFSNSFDEAPGDCEHFLALFI